MVEKASRKLSGGPQTGGRQTKLVQMMLSIGLTYNTLSAHRIPKKAGCVDGRFGI